MRAARFKPGDRVRVTQTGRTGTVVSMRRQRSAGDHPFYTVRWDATGETSFKPVADKYLEKLEIDRDILR